MSRALCLRIECSVRVALAVEEMGKKQTAKAAGTHDKRRGHETAEAEESAPAAGGGFGHPLLAILDASKIPTENNPCHPKPES